MIASLNSLLAPLTALVKQYRKYIGWFFVFLAVCTIPLAFISNTAKFTGEQALNILWFLLFLPIFAKVIGLDLAKALMPLRKEIGICMGTLAIVHGLSYILPDPMYVFDAGFWKEDGLPSYRAFGFVAWIVILLLTLTSNLWSMRLLGPRWKRLHRLVYIAIILIVIHVVLLKWHKEFELGPVILLMVYFVGKVMEWRGVRIEKRS